MRELAPDPSWRTLFARTDDEGLAELRAAVGDVVAALRHVPHAARSSNSPTALRATAHDITMLTDAGEPLGHVAEELGVVAWANGVNPLDPLCVAHLHPPTTLAAAVTDFATSVTNQSMDSFDQSPIASHVELALMETLRGLIGFPSTASGVMTSGGTASNVLAMTLARARLGERVGHDVGQHGLPDSARTWRIVCSDQAHFSLQRAAAQLGLGRDAVVTVATDALGAMRVDALDETLSELSANGLVVMALVGTAGTTDLGAIDPLAAISERAERVGAWFHVDGAVAGAFVMSERLRGRLVGVERADSITIDFHKLWWQPFNASALVTKDVEVFSLLRVRSIYLDRGDELDDMVNLVGRSLDTSRRFDAAKVVASLKHLGRDRFGAMLDYLVDLTNEAAHRLEATGSWQLVAPPSATTCVFYAPEGNDDDLRRVQQSLLVSGEAIIGRTTIRGRAALKFTFMNPLLTGDDLDRLINVVTATLHNR